MWYTLVDWREIASVERQRLFHWSKTPAITCTTYQVHHQHQQFFLLQTLKALQVALFKGIKKKETWETSRITETVIAVQMIYYKCLRCLCQLAAHLNLNCTATLEANWELGVRPEGSSWLFIVLCLPIAVAQSWTARSPNSGCWFTYWWSLNAYSWGPHLPRCSLYTR